MQDGSWFPMGCDVGLLVRSGLWVAACAVTLLAASARSMGLAAEPELLALAGFGTLGVYGFERWAVARYARPWWILPTAVALAFGLLQPLRVMVLLGAVCGLALVHARLREVPWVKPAYIAVAWLGVVVGLPWVIRGAGPVPHALGPVGLAVAANVLACDAIDREAEAVRMEPRRVWWIARGVALAGVIAGWPDPLVAVPAAVLVALVRWPADRRYAERVLDGAVLGGAVLALVLG